MHTVNALRALGIEIEQPEPTELIVHGKKRVLTPAAGEIDCGNSGTAMRLLAGLLAGQTFRKQTRWGRLSFTASDGSDHHSAAQNGREHCRGRPGTHPATPN